MKQLIIVLIVVLNHSILTAQSQLDKKWLMAFHVCGTACNGFQDHQVYLAESDNFTSWSLVSGFVPYSGSVPDILTRQNQLYLFTPGKVKRFTQGTGFTDSNPVGVSVRDANNNPVNFVDPSPILDSQGNIVLFFLNSTGIMGDPAGCNPYPCTKYFDSATEVPGSDGTQFVLDAGHRYEIQINSGTASDPDIFEGNNGYYLYVSRGSSTAAFHSATLSGTYTSLGLPNDILTHEGGIPAGIYDVNTSKYHSFVHSNQNGSIIIKSKEHPDFSQSIQNLTTVVSGPIIGLSANDKTESPGVCANQIITKKDPLAENESATVFTIYDNWGQITGWKIENNNSDQLKWGAYSIIGGKINSGKGNKIQIESIPKGINILHWTDENGKIISAKIINPN